MKLIHQGGLHNHDNNDTHTCSIPIETRSRLNLTICVLVTRYIMLVKTCTNIKIMFFNRIDNLHNHDNSIILIFIFLIRLDTVQNPGNALITPFSDIIERIKS